MLWEVCSAPGHSLSLLCTTYLRNVHEHLRSDSSFFLSLRSVIRCVIHPVCLRCKCHGCMSSTGRSNFCISVLLTDLVEESESMRRAGKDEDEGEEPELQKPTEKNKKMASIERPIMTCDTFDPFLTIMVDTTMRDAIPMPICVASNLTSLNLDCNEYESEFRCHVLLESWRASIFTAICRQGVYR